MKYIPREYQADCRDQALEYFEYCKKKRRIARGVIVSPTGSGKSLIIADTTKRLEEASLVLQPSQELLEQNYEKFTNFGGEASIFSNSLGVKEIGHTTYGTPISVAKSIDLFRSKGIKNLLIDECHLNTKKEGEINKIITELGIKNVMGYTATALELRQNQSMGAYLQIMTRSKNNLFRDIVHVVQIPDIVKQGFWADLKYSPQEVETHKLELTKNGNDYTELSMTEFYEHNDLENRIVNEINALEWDGRDSTLVCVPTIDIAEALKSRLYNAVAVHSKSTASQRRKAVNAFKNYEVPVAITVRALETGFDHPGLKEVILARPTNSFAIYYQQVGRVVRPHETKGYGGVVDFSGNYDKFGELEKVVYKKSKSKWEMFGADRQITNVSAHTGKPYQTPKRGVNPISREELIPIWFGTTHRGKVVTQLPDHYLKWMLKDFQFHTPKSKKLKHQIEVELHIRQ